MQRVMPPRRREKSKRCRRGVWPRSIAKGVGFSCLIFCILFCATVTSAVGAWTRGVAPRGRASQVRGVVQQRRDRGQGVSGSIFGGSEPGVSSDVASSEILFRRHPLRRHLQVPPSVLPRLLSPLSVQRHMLRGFRSARVRSGRRGADQFVNAVAQPLPDADV